MGCDSGHHSLLRLFRSLPTSGTDGDVTAGCFVPLLVLGATHRNGGLEQPGGSGKAAARCGWSRSYFPGWALQVLPRFRRTKRGVRSTWLPFFPAGTGRVGHPGGCEFRFPPWCLVAPGGNSGGQQLLAGPVWVPLGVTPECGGHPWLGARKAAARCGWSGTPRPGSSCPGTWLVLGLWD